MKKLAICSLVILFFVLTMIDTPIRDCLEFALIYPLQKVVDGWSNGQKIIWDWAYHANQYYFFNRDYRTAIVGVFFTFIMYVLSLVIPLIISALLYLIIPIIIFYIVIYAICKIFSVVRRSIL